MQNIRQHHHSIQQPDKPFQDVLSSLRIHPRHPPVDLDDLVMMLEIDFTLGRRADFKTRLKRALIAAAQKGQSQKITSSLRKMEEQREKLAKRKR